MTMDRSTFDKLSDSKKMGALFDLLAQLADRQSATDKNIVDRQSAMDKNISMKVDTISKEIKHAFKQVSDRVEVVEKVAGLEHGWRRRLLALRLRPGR